MWFSGLLRCDTLILISSRLWLVLDTFSYSNLSFGENAQYLDCGDLSSLGHLPVSTYYESKIESVKDFLIKLEIKPLMHLLEIRTFSLNNVIMNRANKNWAHF